MCVCVCRGGHLVDKQKKQKTQTIKNHIRSRPCYSCVFWPHQQLCVSNGIWRPSQSIHRHSISPLFFLFFFWLLFFTQAARQSQDSYHEKHREHPDDGEWRKKIPFSFLCQEWETCFFFCWMLRNSSHSASKAFPERIQCSIFSFELFQGTSSRSRSLELSKLTQPQSKTNTKKTVYPLDTNLGGHICHTRMKKKKSSSSKLWIDHFSSMLLAVLITVSFSSIKWIVSLGGSKHTKIKFLQACVSWWKCV